MPVDRALTDEEAALVALWTRNSWSQPPEQKREADVELMVSMYAPDAISMPANHPALHGTDEIREWYVRRIGEGHERNTISDVDAIDIVGDVAILAGTFRVTRRPEDGVAGLDHAGRWLSVLRKVDGTWRMWRDMDTPSPDADRYYGRVARGR
jgi:ketosteroid isomerase-like protein